MRLRKQIYFVIILLAEIGSAQIAGSGTNLDFGGNSSRVVFGNIYRDIELPFSLSAWVLIPPDATSDRQYFFASCWPDNKVYSGFWVAIGADSFGIAYGDGNGALHPAFRRSKSVSFPGDIRGIWTYVTFVVEGPTNMKLYLNGIELGGSYSGSGNENMIGVADGKAQIGFLSNNNGDHFFNGRLDDIRLWNFALSDSDIKSNLAKKLKNNQSGLVGYWPLDEGSGVTVEESINENIGSIEGDLTWQTSGAPLGDESYYEYFSAGTKRKLFKNNADSFWISTESNNWVGYHVYKVNESPNTSQGSTLSFSDGYYGIFPVFSNGEQNDYTIEVYNSACSILEYRSGNDDPSWETATQSTDSTLQIYMNGISEIVFEAGGTLKSLANSYTICFDETINIDATDNCTEEYLWSTGSKDPSVTIGQPGNYWLERSTPSGVFRDDFSVILIERQSDLISEESYVICNSDFPFELASNVKDNIIWSTNEQDSLILVSEVGYYWVEYVGVCQTIRDSVYVGVHEFTDPSIPNVLTPNNDGLNDCFIIDQELIGSEFIVFNRAGTTIFTSSSYTNNWCPDIPAGTYFYQISNSCYQDSFEGWISVLK